MLIAIHNYYNIYKNVIDINYFIIVYYIIVKYHVLIISIRSLFTYELYLNVLNIRF